MLRNLREEQINNLAIVGSLMKGMGHNINTPLATIMGRSEMIKLRCQKLKDQIVSQTNSVSDDLNRNIKDISLIIENTEKVSEIVKNVMQKCINELLYSVKVINLSLLLREELRFLEADMSFKHNIEKVYNLNDVIPGIYGVYSHFSYSFLQILENSKKAMVKSEIKQLAVSLECHNKCITVIFHDTGCGIESQKKEDILQFLNSSPSDNNVSPTITGGIYNVKMLLRAYNPSFDLSSRPGDTTFVIRFPLN